MRPTVCRSTLNYTPTSEISATSEIKTQTAEPFQRKNPKLNTCSRNLSDSAGDAFDVLFALGGWQFGIQGRSGYLEVDLSVYFRNSSCGGLAAVGFKHKRSGARVTNPASLMSAKARYSASWLTPSSAASDL
jgi:hypothetical protein